jgi:hypothetical protein
MISNASDIGISFENTIFENLQKSFPKFIIRREKDIVDDYGKDISAIDFEIYKQIKMKDITKEKNIHIFIQVKWKEKSESSKNVNHFIQCCNEIIKMKKLKDEDCHPIYVTKVPVSKVSMEALKRLKNCENIFDENMDQNIKTLTKKISEILNVKLPKENKIEIPTITNDTNYEELKKIILVGLVMKEFNINKTTASKFKHSELVKMLKEKKCLTSNNLDNKLNSKYLTVEYDEPKIRNIGEVKSKLLKPGSELYNFISKMKSFLRSIGITHQDRMGLHTEVLNDNSESLETFLSRVDNLEGREIDVYNFDNYDVVGRAVVLLLGDLDGYDKDAKITIAFLGETEKADNALVKIGEYIQSIVDDKK